MKSLLALFTLSVLAACSGDQVQAAGAGESKAPAAGCCADGCCADKAPVAKEGDACCADGAGKAEAKQGDACCAEGAAKDSAAKDSAAKDSAAKDGAAKDGAAKEGASCECCSEKAPGWKPAETTKPKQ